MCIRDSLAVPCCEDLQRVSPADALGAADLLGDDHPPQLDVYKRQGYRGYGSGALVQDPKFEEHFTNARNAGLRVGIYCFSQAVNENCLLYTSRCV